MNRQPWKHLGSWMNHHSTASQLTGLLPTMIADIRPRCVGNSSVHENHRTCRTFPMTGPKCLMRDFTNLNRIYKAHWTNVWWTMKVFHEHWNSHHAGPYPSTWWNSCWSDAAHDEGRLTWFIRLFTAKTLETWKYVQAKKFYQCSPSWTSDTKGQFRE